MKNIFKRVLLIAVGVLLVCVLSSCALSKLFGPKDADALIKKIDKTMDQYSSYESDMDFEAKIGSGPALTKVYLFTKNVVINDKNEAYYFYQKMETTAALVDASGEEKVVSEGEDLIAFDRGNAFYMSQKDDKTVRLYSESTKNDFGAYLEKSGGNLDTDVLFGGCSKKQMTHEKDGTWTLKLGEYSKESMNKIWESLGLDAVSELTESSNPSLKIKADKEYRMTSCEMHLVISGKEDNESDYDSILEGTFTFGSFGEAKRVENELSTDAYTKVDNALILPDAVRQLSGWCNLKNGEFSMVSSQNVKYPGSEVSVTVTDEIKFSTSKEDGFNYSIKEHSTDASTPDITLKYSGGTLYTQAGSQMNRQSMDESQAKQSIRKVLGTVSVDPVFVTSIEDNGNGVYEIRADGALDEQYKGVYKECTYVVRLTFRDDKLVATASEITLVGNNGTKIVTRTELTQKN